jgi:hypothetical protein
MTPPHYSSLCQLEKLVVPKGKLLAAMLEQKKRQAALQQKQALIQQRRKVIAPRTKMSPTSSLGIANLTSSTSRPVSATMNRKATTATTPSQVTLNDSVFTKNPSGLSLTRSKQLTRQLAM